MVEEISFVGRTVVEVEVEVVELVRMVESEVEVVRFAEVAIIEVEAEAEVLVRIIELEAVVFTILVGKIDVLVVVLPAVVVVALTPVELGNGDLVELEEEDVGIVTFVFSLLPEAQVIFILGEAA